MGPRDAVAKAKAYVADLFASDGAKNVGLEELRYDPETARWSVTVGFSRAWDGPQGVSRWMSDQRGEPWPRTFKIVEIDNSSGEVIDLKHRTLAA